MAARAALAAWANGDGDGVRRDLAQAERVGRLPELDDADSQIDGDLH